MRRTAPPGLDKSPCRKYCNLRSFIAGQGLRRQKQTKEVDKMSENNSFLGIPGWYPRLGAYSLFTTFVTIPEEARNYLASADREHFEGAEELNRHMIELLKRPMEAFSGYVFASVDRCAPTDTLRFEQRYGAVHRAEQTWNILCDSRKVRESAAAGEVTSICLRPFHRMNIPREFRLFIRDGELVAMSQYHLIRHFRRLEGVKVKYWKLAEQLVKLVGWALPLKELVMDIYIASDDRTYIVDLNPWGPPTDPLLLRTWDRDWSKVVGIVLMEPPAKLSGSVDVSF